MQMNVLKITNRYHLVIFVSISYLCCCIIISQVFCFIIQGTRPAKRAILITLILSLLHQLSGNFTLLSYVTTIFKEAGSNLSPNHSSIVVSTVQLIASFVAVSLIDKLGRKILLSISAFGSAFFLICTGLYALYKDELTSYTWIPILTFSATIFVQSMGLITIYMVTINEILPKKVFTEISFCFQNCYVFSFFFSDKKCRSLSEFAAAMDFIIYFSNILPNNDANYRHTWLHVFLCFLLCCGCHFGVDFYSRN